MSEPTPLAVPSGTSNSGAPAGGGWLRPAVFFGLAILCLSPLLGLQGEALALVAPGALIGGMLLGLTLGNPYPDAAKKFSRTLLQASVVLLGFSLELQKVVQAGVRGLGFGLVSIALVFALGAILQRVLGVRPITSLLVSTGTAICGGSAIAAMASVVEAPQEDVSVAVGTVFLLNALALVTFPFLGHALGLTGTQFGMWAGIAIHDVSSVVGAATSFGNGSLETATAVKLSRVLYLVPITLGAAFFVGRSRTGPRQAPPIPWFIALFLLASMMRSGVAALAPLAPSVKVVASSGFALSLFLIGAGVSRKTLRAVGVKPLVEGAILWAFVSVAALLSVRAAG